MIHAIMDIRIVIECIGRISAMMDDVGGKKAYPKVHQDTMTDDMFQLAVRAALSSCINDNDNIYHIMEYMQHTRRSIDILRRCNDAVDHRVISRDIAHRMFTKWMSFDWADDDRDVGMCIAFAAFGDAYGGRQASPFDMLGDDGIDFMIQASRYRNAVHGLSVHELGEGVHCILSYIDDDTILPHDMMFMDAWMRHVIVEWEDFAVDDFRSYVASAKEAMSDARNALVKLIGINTHEYISCRHDMRVWLPIFGCSCIEPITRAMLGHDIDIHDVRSARHFADTALHAMHIGSDINPYQTWSGMSPNVCRVLFTWFEISLMASNVRNGIAISSDCYYSGADFVKPMDIDADTLLDMVNMPIDAALEYAMMRSDHND